MAQSCKAPSISQFHKARPLRLRSQLRVKEGAASQIIRENSLCQQGNREINLKDGDRLQIPGDYSARNGRVNLESLFEREGQAFRVTVDIDAELFDSASYPEGSPEIALPVKREREGSI